MIEAIVNAITTTVQATVDPISAFVEAVFYAVTAIVDMIGDLIYNHVGVVSQNGAAQYQHPCD